MAHTTDSMPLAGLGRRFFCLFYEALLLVALMFVAMLLAMVLLFALSKVGFAAEDFQHRWLWQVYGVLVLLSLYGYLAFAWLRTGQTLAMKTWRLQVVSVSGGLMTRRQSRVRFAVAMLGVICAGAGFVWAWIDRDRQFLHDRMAGTRQVLVPLRHEA
jgi:uncharacterized RDD family membrane protein YckC